MTVYFDFCLLASSLREEARRRDTSYRLGI